MALAVPFDRYGYRSLALPTWAPADVALGAAAHAHRGYAASASRAPARDRSS